MQHVVFLGPQGAGKGTQAALIAPRFHLLHLATGDLFRSLMEQDTALAQEVRSYYDRGELVPDELTARVLFDVLDRKAGGERITGALIDGFPRNAAQAEILDTKVNSRGETLAAVVHIVVPRNVLMQRLTGRLICRDCGRSYHVVFNPPAESDVCDVCGGELYTRSDDTAEAVERRLNIYFEQTEPLLDHWRGSGIVHDIDGNQAIDAVGSSIEAVLDSVFPGIRT